MATTSVGSIDFPQRKAARLRFQDRRRLFLITLAVPAVVYVVLIALWPLAQGIWYSFFDYNLLRGGGRRTFVGLANYSELWTDSTARRALINTFVFTFAAVALEFVFGLCLALLLWREGRFNRICLAFLLIPVTITPVVVGLIFRALLAVDYGFFGYYLAEWGISGPRGFLASTSAALPVVILIDVWEWTAAGGADPARRAQVAAGRYPGGSLGRWRDGAAALPSRRAAAAAADRVPGAGVGG